MPKTKYLATTVKLAIVAAKELDQTDQDVAKFQNVTRKPTMYIASVFRADLEKLTRFTINQLYS